MNKAESADLIIKLYELRREATMREARVWMMGFSPQSAQDVMKAMMDPNSSAYFRMVISYWDMAASFVNHGAIDEDMFNEVNGEGILVFAKVQPFLAELREGMGNPLFLSRLESWIMRMPDAAAMLEQRRAMIKRMFDARQEFTKAQAAAGGESE
jgi:hypothetical protein